MWVLYHVFRALKRRKNANCPARGGGGERGASFFYEKQACEEPGEWGIIEGMDVLFGVMAAIVGAALGWVQVKLLQWILLKGKIWMIAVKLPLWAVFMIAALAVSLSTLIWFVAAATVSFVAFGFVQWRKQR